MRYLLEALTETYTCEAEQHQTMGWTLERKSAGMNGLIYKAQSDNPAQNPLAIKISQRDERQRTIREFGAMNALITMGLRRIVPVPIVFHDEPEGLPGDVLVMEWLEGETLQSPPPPEDKQLWRAILLNFADIHTVNPIPQIKLFDAVMSILHPLNLLDIVIMRRYRLPKTGQIGLLTGEAIDNLIEQAKKQIPMMWDETPQQSLILCDANPNNMLLHNGQVRVVDWANSGWADGAFDIADILSQPSYIHLPNEHQSWIRKAYSEMVENPQVIERIQLYEQLMYIFWVCGMSQPFVGASPKRIAGVKQYPLEHYEKYQKIYWDLAQNAFT